MIVTIYKQFNLLLCICLPQHFYRKLCRQLGCSENWGIIDTTGHTPLHLLERESNDQNVSYKDEVHKCCHTSYILQAHSEWLKACK